MLIYMKARGKNGGAMWRWLVAMGVIWSKVVFAEPISQPVHDSAPEAGFTYEDLVHLIESHSAKSIEELLPFLPLAMRSNYTLMSKSESLQEASKLEPRVILFGEDASLTCSFNGGTLQAGSDTLECFQFRKSTRSFDFRQIQFPTSKNELKEVRFSTANRSADGRLACGSCHGDDPRPNWDKYSVWPGAYGENDDDLSRDEKLAYKAFVTMRAVHPRYQHLIQDDDETAPYQSHSRPISMDRRPNLRFSDAIGRMNGLRTARLLAERVPSWQAVAYAFQKFNCSLSKAQKDRLAANGREAPAISSDQILASTGVSARDWTSRFSEDRNSDYEHQAGFSFLSVSTSMGVVMTLVQAGNSSLGQAVEEIMRHLPSETDKAYLPFLQSLNRILPDPNTFGGHYSENTASLCPDLSEELVRRYLQL